MGEFSYLPLRGPLSGASFENQTTAFFEKLASRMQSGFDQFDGVAQSLQLRLDALSGRMDENSGAIDKLKADVANLVQTTAQLRLNLDSLTQYGQATRQTVNEIQTEVSALKAMQNEQAAKISDHETRLSALETASPPDGFIGLMDGGDLPEAWRECNGENGAPDLSGLVEEPLRYIQRRAPDEGEPEEGADEELEDATGGAAEDSSGDGSGEEEASQAQAQGS